MFRYATVPVIFVCCMASSVFAGSVSYWTPSIDAPDRTLALIEGDIKSWSWKGGVVIAEAGGSSKTIARANVFEVYRYDDERSEALAQAFNAGTEAAFEDVFKTEKNELDKEEALYQIARMAPVTRKTADAIKAQQRYIGAYKDGHYLGQVYAMLASLFVAAKQPDEAIKTYEAMAALGDAQKAAAFVNIGELHAKAGTNDKALVALETAVEPARKVQDAALEMRALGWGGEAARRQGMNDKAKQMFEALFKVPAERGYDPVARGLAFKGLGDLGGDTAESYRNYELASYWLSRTEYEGPCVVRMMQVADSLASATGADQHWKESAQTLRALVKARWPALEQSGQ